MQKVMKVYKKIGLTPLQLINKFRAGNKEYKSQKIAFAGRLDPMAEGLMLLLIGEEAKNRKMYLNLDKEYEFEVLFGVSTDTYDALGLLNNELIKQWSNLVVNQKIFEKKIKQFITTKLGKQLQSYPPYSSKTVNGIPLFQLARENKLSKIKIPKKEIEIFTFELLDIKEVPAEKIIQRIINNINTVNGDFRQKDIIENWKKFLNSNTNNSLITASFKIACTSGTYVRSIANDMGEKLKCGAIAVSIKRTRIGNYKA